MTPEPPRGWWARAVALWPERADLLRAFGGADETSSCGEGILQNWLQQTVLDNNITAVLSGELDAAQARMFARRHAAARGLVQRLGLPGLEALLVGRTAEILRAPGPRGLRVRAVADFVYSQAARLHHQRHTPPRSIAALAATARWEEVGPGLAHARLTGPGPAGPVHINLLRAAQGVRAQCREVRAEDGGLAAIVARHGAQAGVSGGFFLYSEPDIRPPLARRQPVGLLVQDGAVVAVPSLHRATLLWDPHPRIARVGPVGWTVACGAHQWTITARNDPALPGPTLFTRASGPQAPRPGLVLRGDRAAGIGTEVDLLGGVLVLPEGTPPDLRGPCEWRPPRPIAQAMAGGPLLLGPGALELAREDFASTAPPITFSQDETYDQNLLPRMAVGQDSDQRLIFAAIDGRDFDRAPGFTLAMTAQLLGALGCTVAMNLDGGSSKRMAVGGRTVDLGTTELVTGTQGTQQPRRRLVSVVLLG